VDTLLTRRAGYRRARLAQGVPRLYRRLRSEQTDHVVRFCTLFNLVATNGLRYFWHVLIWM
jgi:hypothetical protein